MTNFIFAVFISLFNVVGNVDISVFMSANNSNKLLGSKMDNRFVVIVMVFIIY